MTASKQNPKHAYTGVPGHGLQNEGAAFLPDRTRAWAVGGPGHGLCSCGELSPEFTSNYKRKNWHRQHKTEVRGANP